ncbi:MAG: hypothetical protein V9G18_13570 [Albidovulum sp.]
MPTAMSMMEAFRANFPGLTQFLTALCYLLGLWAGVSATLLVQRRQRHDGGASRRAILARGALCAVFLYLPTAIDSGQETLFGARAILGYSAGSAVSEPGRQALDAVIGFVRLVGLAAFAWGWVLLDRAHARGHYDPALGNKAVAHLVGGALCINVVATLQGLAQTFGLEKLLAHILVAGG